MNNEQELKLLKLLNLSFYNTHRHPYTAFLKQDLQVVQFKQQLYNQPTLAKLM
jgi:hypothetical protein